MTTTLTLEQGPEPDPINHSEGRTLRRALVVAICALTAMTGFLIGSNRHRGHPVTVLEGSVYTDVDRSAVTNFRGHRIAGPAIDPHFTRAFDVRGVLWSDGRSWHEDAPVMCLKALGVTTVQIGVVAIDPYNDAPGGAAVKWIKCLNQN